MFTNSNISQLSNFYPFVLGIVKLLSNIKQRLISPLVYIDVHYI